MERRNIADVEFRFSESDEGNILTGYAARFGVWSEDLGFFKEKIQAGAFAKTIKENDIRALFNHDPNLILGRTKNKTLELEEDEKGLLFNMVLPDTTYAADLKKSIERKDVTQNSFGFQMIKDEWSPDGKKRTLLEAKLFDISPVTFPAYPQTSVKVRFANHGIDYDELVEAVKRRDEGIVLRHDHDLIMDTVTVLNRYLKEPEPAHDDHSGAQAEPAAEGLFDPVTLIKMRIAEMKSNINRGIL